MNAEELSKLGIPAELHENPLLKEAKDAAALAKIAIDLKAYQGGSIRIPSENAGEEDRKAFREKLKQHVPDLVELPRDPAKLEKAEEEVLERLGRPKDPKAYPDLKSLGIEVPEGVDVDVEGIRAYAHRLGMTKRQFAALAKQVVEEREKATRAASSEMQALRRELGTAFEERLSAAAAAAKKLGYSKEKVEAIAAGRISVEDARTWINVAKALGTEGASNLDLEGGRGRVTRDEALAQIEEIYRNPDFHNAASPRHQVLLERYYELHRVAYPAE